MTDVREKLVELLQHDNCPLFMVFGDKVDVLADYLIAHGVTFAEDINVPAKWIPVTERLPDTEDRVLVCCKTKKGLQTINMAYLFNGTWHGQGSMSGVTHWMPIPEPPWGDSPC